MPSQSRWVLNSARVKINQPMALLLPVKSLLACITIGVLLVANAQAIEIDKSSSIKDATSSVLGINHIGLSVADLEKSLTFYRAATNFEIIRREKITDNATADKLYGQADITYEVAVLKAPNMLLELREFAQHKNAETQTMPPQGPGMTHTCFQSPASDSGFDKFVKAGAIVQTSGDKPIDLGGYGVTYAYVYDPEGNMLELEQIDGEVLARSGYDSTWKDLGLQMWMSQVALVTHDIERLMQYYQGVLGFKPYRTGELIDNPKASKIAGVDDMHVLGGWFRMSDTSKTLEFWQYKNPVTTEFTGQRDATSLGYSFSLEVGDIQAEHQRLTELGVEFISEPVQLAGFWQAYARDIDGNIFSLRQAVDSESELSVRVLDNI